MSLRDREERLLAAVAYGIRRQSWGERLLDQAYGPEGAELHAYIDVAEEALEALQRVAHRAGFLDFDAQKAR